MKSAYSDGKVDDSVNDDVEDDVTKNEKTSKTKKKPSNSGAMDKFLTKKQKT